MRKIQFFISASLCLKRIYKLLQFTQLFYLDFAAAPLCIIICKLKSFNGLNEIESRIMLNINSKIITTKISFSLLFFKPSRNFFLRKMKGMSMKQMQELPLVENSMSGDCVICLGTLSGKTRILPCCHGFHEACIFQWLCINSTCPYCRLPLMQPREFMGKI